MASLLKFSSISNHERIDVENGIIRGVVVIEAGEAKGHDLQIDSESLESFMKLATARKAGVKVRFGNDHKAGVEDTNGSLKDFRMDGSKIRADMHLLKTDPRNVKLMEMAEKMPEEFGLSAVTDAKRDGKNFASPIYFTQLDCVDIVSSPAATQGLFFSEPTNTQPQTSMLKEFALLLGLPETATEQEIKVALEAKCKPEAKKEDDKKELEADDEEKGKDKKKLEAIEAQLLELSSKIQSINDNTQAAKDAAHKAEIEGLKLEASKDGKVIPLSDEALIKLSIPEIKDVIGKLPKNQVKLNKGNIVPGDNKPLDKRSPEFKAQLAAKRAEGALLLGQKMLNK